MEEWRSGARELGRRNAGVQTWRYIWRSGASEARCRRVDVEVRSSEAWEARSGGILQACRREILMGFDGFARVAREAPKLGLHGHRTEYHATVSRNADRREGIEGWRRAVGVATWRSGGVEVWSSGGALRTRRRGGTELWRRTARCADAEV